ncbi:hypothetical protein T05_6089 [Trichinella murrelli]|uniref:Uncharacterized protein n=1 Tax=Trichinella murrelli TaxID=144512 RepID=A0A0V0TNI7_9BILA|nr:hypothetical protein T05_6089 [Trichinella murrelli]
MVEFDLKTNIMLNFLGKSRTENLAKLFLTQARPYCLRALQAEWVATCKNFVNE